MGVYYFFPENMTHTTVSVISDGTSGIPPPQRCHRKLTQQEQSRAMSTAAASKQVEDLELNEM